MFWAIAIIAVLLVAGLWFWFEGRWDRRIFAAEPGRRYANFNAAQAKAWLLEHTETQVLDVRSAAEHERGALPDAVNISLGDPAFDEKLSSLDKTRPVLVYCAGGYRSRKAVERMKRLGFHNILHIHRGYMSWKTDKAFSQSA